MLICFKEWLVDSDTKRRISRSARTMGIDNSARFRAEIFQQ